MGEREGIGKIGEEKHESREDKYFSRRKKYNSDFIKRGQIHCDVLWICRDLRKENIHMFPIKTTSSTLRPPVVR